MKRLMFQTGAHTGDLYGVYVGFLKVPPCSRMIELQSLIDKLSVLEEFCNCMALAKLYKCFLPLYY